MSKAIKIELDQATAAAVAGAVHQAIAVVGISGLMATSMFPSAARRSEQYKLAA